MYWCHWTKLPKSFLGVLPFYHHVVHSSITTGRHDTTSGPGTKAEELDGSRYCILLVTYLTLPAEVRYLSLFLLVPLPVLQIGVTSESYLHVVEEEEEEEEEEDDAMSGSQESQESQTELRVAAITS
ncbi:hypothetical protein B0H66DRAFT_533135 [Apodospora peruviana]|uniref:Uncharacterized protein n=1 Tax=Apodospora peruviana TaxID=516989 RepID=A0AAE0I588_9PEZI|nr:hypothetical protein B0H66DRAFT_533135 [Apodospora peruviana]